MCRPVVGFSLQIDEGPLALRDIASSQPIIIRVPALGGAHSIGVQSRNAQSRGFTFRCRPIALFSLRIDEGRLALRARYRFISAYNNPRSCTRRYRCTFYWRAKPQRSKPRFQSSLPIIVDRLVHSGVHEI